MPYVVLQHCFTDDFMCTTTPTELLCCSCSFFGQFRVQTVATAMNATGSVDTTPACTRAYAHYSRSHFTRDDCTCGSRLISVAHFSKTLSSLCHVLVRCACHCSLSRHSPSSTRLARTRSNPCTSAHLSGMSGCLANPTPHTASSCPKRNEQARIEIEKLQTELEDDGQKIKQNAQRGGTRFRNQCIAGG